MFKHIAKSADPDKLITFIAAYFGISSLVLITATPSSALMPHQATQDADIIAISSIIGFEHTSPITTETYLAIPNSQDLENSGTQALEIDLHQHNQQLIEKVASQN